MSLYEENVFERMSDISLYPLKVALNHTFCIKWLMIIFISHLLMNSCMHKLIEAQKRVCVCVTILFHMFAEDD